MVAVPLLAEKSMPIMFLKEYSHLYSCMASGRVVQRPQNSLIEITQNPRSEKHFYFRKFSNTLLG